MTSPTYTHFKYFCRCCSKEIFVPINQEGPASSPHPSCCGSTRWPAYRGPVNLNENKT